MVFSFAFFGGVLGALVLPPWATAWIALPLLPLALIPLLARRSPGVIALCGFVLGFLYTGLHAHDYLRQRWPVAKADDRVIAEVIVDSVPAPRGGDWAFDGIVTVNARRPMKRPLRVRLVSRDATVRPHAGERWRLLLALRPPRARANPGAPDFERVLFHDRVHALGSVVSSPINRRIDAGHRPLDALRERVAQHIDERVADREASALISALAVGVTGGMSREQWRIFNVTGTTHLVAISGMHVTLFAVIAFALARRLWSGALWRFVRCPRENFAALAGLIAAAAYATLAGLSVPTQRTLIMLGVWLMTRSVARASVPFHSFALALVAVLLLDPFAPLAAGFWLSFGAMGAIILVAGARFVRRHWIFEATAVQAAVTVALTPLTIAAFGSVSVIGPLVNIAAIPVMSWVFVPTILLSVVLIPALPAISDWILSVAARMHDASWPWLARAADLPWALIHMSPPLWWYGLAFVGVLISLMPLPLTLRAAALACVLPLAATTVTPPDYGVAEITVLDVGEGASIVVQTAHHVLVYGTGDAYGTDGRVAESVLVPFLRSRGVREIDVLVASRLTPVSSSGITALFAELPVAATLVGGTAPADFEGARACYSVNSWRWDGVEFHLLHPEPSPRGPDASLSGAEGSRPCVLVVASGARRALLPGDLDAATERSLARAGGLSADLAVIPRNGSDAASTSEFIGAVDARWAVVSGRRTRNAIEKRAITRWREHGAAVLATSDLGAIQFRIGPGRGGGQENIERSGEKRDEAPAGWRQDDSLLQLGTLWRSLP